MAVTSRDLHDLIHSLTKSEKGYFKKFSSGYRNERQNNYILLFNFLDKQEVFDEQEAINYFKRKKIKINFSALRKYLYDQILKCLRTYFSETTIPFELRELLGNIEILTAKGLIHQSLELVKEGLSITEREQVPVYSILFQYAHRHLLDYCHNASKYEAELKVDDAVQRQADKIMQYEQLIKIARRSLFLVSKHVPLRDEVAKEEVNHLFDQLKRVNPAELSTCVYQDVYHSAYARVCQLKGDYTNAIIHQAASVTLLKKQCDSKPTFTQSYLSSLFNLGILYNFNNEYVHAKKIIGMLYHYKSSIHGVEFHKMTLYYTLLVDYVMCSKQFDELKPKLPELELLQPADFSTPNSYYTIQFFLGVYYFREKNYEKSLTSINQLLNSRGDYLQFSFKLHCRLMNILIHYELGDLQLLENLIKNTYRFLIKNELKFAFERELLNFFKRLLNVVNKEKMARLLEQLYDRIQLIKNDPAERLALKYYFDYTEWLEEKKREAVAFKWAKGGGEVKGLLSY